MRHTNESGTSSRNENMNKQHEELTALQRRFFFLVNATTSSLEQIQMFAERALREQHGEGEMPAWPGGKDGALPELLALVERARRDVQIASTCSPSSFLSAALPEDGAAHAVMSGRASSEMDSKTREDEVSKAHQLARLLQERNAMREMLMNAEGMNASLQLKLSSLSDEHNRLLQTLADARNEESTSMNAATAVASPQNIPLEVVKEAIRRLYDRRVKELEEELMSAREELRQLKTEGGDVATRPSVSSVKLKEERGTLDPGRRLHGGGETEDAVEGLRRQNTFLRNKLMRLKEEVHASQQASVVSAEQMNEGLGSLLKTITRLQQDVETKERQRADGVLALEDAGRRAEQFAARVEKLERQMAQMRVDGAASGSFCFTPLFGDQRGAEANGLGSAMKATVAEKEAELRLARRDANDLETRLGRLTGALAKARELLHEKEVEQAKLQLKLSETQGMWEAAQSQLEHMRTKENLLDKLEAEMRHAVEALLRPLGPVEGTGDSPEGERSDRGKVGINGALQRRLDAILERLRGLEWLDLQLRKRDDAVVILQDEKADLEERCQHLQQTLSKLSNLFDSIPQTPLEVEQLVLERDVFLAALRRCEELAVVPNTKEACRRVELRKMELAAQQEMRQRSTSHVPQLQQRTANSPTSFLHGVVKNGTSPNGGATGACFSCRSPSIVVEEEEEEEKGSY
ncbi:hook complex protein, conserved [Trypanosoma cruzi]|nr:hook complex protein, conserved [Trypanosoma cruzi]